MKLLWISNLSRRGDVEVVRSAMFHRCPTTSQYLSAKAVVYFAPGLCPYDEWLIDWSQRRVQVESCQKQKYLINIWFLLFSRGDPAAGPDWPLTPADCFLLSVLIPLAGDPQNHPKQNNQELGRSPVKQRGCAVKFIFREEQNNTHTALIMSLI